MNPKQNNDLRFIFPITNGNVHRIKFSFSTELTVCFNFHLPSITFPRAQLPVTMTSCNTILKRLTNSLFSQSIIWDTFEWQAQIIYVNNILK